MFLLVVKGCHYAQILINVKVKINQTPAPGGEKGSSKSDEQIEEEAAAEQEAANAALKFHNRLAKGDTVADAVKRLEK